jgi:hypothetical protein
MKQNFAEVVGGYVISAAVFVGLYFLFRWAGIGKWGADTGEISSIPRFFRFVIAIGITFYFLDRFTVRAFF